MSAADVGRSQRLACAQVALVNGLPQHHRYGLSRRLAAHRIQAGVDWNQVRLLEEAVQPPSETVVFKSVGDALWDLAAARLAYRTACL